MSCVKQDRNRCQGHSWRMVGVHQTDDDKGSNHGEHRRSDTAAERTESRSNGSPANRAHNQRIHPATT